VVEAPAETLLHREVESGIVKRRKARQAGVFIVNRIVSGKGRFSGRKAEASVFRRHTENSNLRARNQNISLDLLGLTIPGRGF
jgi:hypothetical protein